ncbi:MAG: serine/threonine protein kinase [Myxococcales bacterium]|nr:serine/threonine protein kinase [Myxococcales bacterium]
MTRWLRGVTVAQMVEGGAPLVGAVLDGRYRLTDLVREGRTAATYHATHVQHGRSLFVKVLGISDPSDEEMGRLRRDASVGVEIAHPGIATPIAVLRTEGGAPFLVYENSGAEELATRLKRVARLSPEEVAAIVTQVASAVGAAHRVAVVHGDLRPGTLLVDGGGAATKVLVIDFGIAGLREGRRPGASQSSMISPALSGLASYMAPEQAHGKRAGPATDQFALAAIAFEMLAGQGAFGSGSAVAILARVLHADPPPMIGVPRDAEGVVLRALAKLPSARYPTIVAFAEALAAACADSSLRGDSGMTPTVPVMQLLHAPQSTIPTARLTIHHVVPPAARGPAPAPRIPAAAPRSVGRASPSPYDSFDDLPARGSGRTIAAWVAAGLGLVAMLALGVHLGQRRGGAPATGTANRPAAVPPGGETESMVRVEIDVDPPYARVRIDDKQVSPPLVMVRRSSAPSRVVIDAAGHLPSTREVVPDRDQRLVVRLTSTSAPNLAPRPRPGRKPEATTPPAATPLRDLRDPFASP